MKGRQAGDDTECACGGGGRARRTGADQGLCLLDADSCKKYAAASLLRQEQRIATEQAAAGK